MHDTEMRTVNTKIFVGLIASGATVACTGEVPVVFSGGGVFNGEGGSWNPGVVVVEAGRIACAGEVSDCTAPPGAELIDTEGAWVIPGIINARVGTEPDPPDEQVAYLRFLLGVTAAGSIPVDFAVGNPDARIPAPRPLEGKSAERLLRQALAGAGADVADPAGGGEARTVAFFQRSAWALADRETLLDSARAFARRGEILAPELLDLEVWAAPYRLPHGLNPLVLHPLITFRIQDRTLPDRTPQEAEILAEAVEAMREFTLEFSANGGRLAVATGEALAPGLAAHEGVRALVDAGLSPGEALMAATSGSAALLGVADSLGSITPGKLADLLIVAGNPLTDITTTQTISRVVKGGVVYDPVVLFDAILEDPGSRVSADRRRVNIALGVLAAALLLVGGTVITHRRALAR